MALVCELLDLLNQLLSPLALLLQPRQHLALPAQSCQIPPLDFEQLLLFFDAGALVQSHLILQLLPLLINLAIPIIHLLHIIPRLLHLLINLYLPGQAGIPDFFLDLVFYDFFVPQMMPLLLVPLLVPEFAGLDLLTPLDGHPIAARIRRVDDRCLQVLGLGLLGVEEVLFELVQLDLILHLNHPLPDPWRTVGCRYRYGRIPLFCEYGAHLLKIAPVVPSRHRHQIAH